MYKNNVGFFLMIVGGVIAIAGCTWGVLVLFGSDFREWVVALFFILCSLFLGAVLLGISELINLADQQIDTQLRIEEKLRKLLPQEAAGVQAVEYCNHCGTQLPPGGKTCPTCHHTNE
ncbi:MAG: hypothetical protein ACOYJZ_07910 [Acutalibacter sp.]